VKKKLLVLTAAASLALSAVPAAGFAQMNENEAVSALSSSGDFAMLALLLNRNGTLPSSGERTYVFSYDTSYGNTISYYMQDTNKKGLSINIYNSGNTLVAYGSTSESNNWQFSSTFSPGQVDDDYTVVVSSHDGKGGSSYGYSVSVRAY